MDKDDFPIPPFLESSWRHIYLSGNLIQFVAVLLLMTGIVLWCRRIIFNPTSLNLSTTNQFILAAFLILVFIILLILYILYFRLSKKYRYIIAGFWALAGLCTFMVVFTLWYIDRLYFSGIGGQLGPIFFPTGMI
ncbi:MAG: hypothetical protein WCG02_00090 [Candidatus Taylorbacteria bacterium]